MKSRRSNSKELLIIALVVIGLGVVNFVFERFTDGTLCVVAGIVILIVWMMKRRR